jgi:hypothetical protein
MGLSDKYRMNVPYLKATEQEHADANWSELDRRFNALPLFDAGIILSGSNTSTLATTTATTTIKLPATQYYNVGFSPYTNTDSVVTCLIGGWYHVNFSALFQNGGVAGYREAICQIKYANSTSSQFYTGFDARADILNIRGSEGGFTAVGGAWMGVTCSHIVPLEVGTTIGAAWFQTTGGNETVTYSHFSVVGHRPFV